jgi:hypothetical protein
VKRAIAAAALALLGAASPARADEPVTSRLYGTVRLDAGLAWDMNDAIAPVRAIDGDGEHELAIHPRLTRIGVEITPDTLDSRVDLDGLLEADLAGDGALGAFRLRHAYVRATRGRFELIAGHTWDLASPLVPSANAATMMWDAGNTGVFRPQLRVSARAGGRTLRVRGAIADDAGAAMPVGQALLEIEHDRGRLGVWGHLGQDETSARIAGHDTFGALLGGGHLRVDIRHNLALHGEAYAGRNATDVRAGSGQSIGNDGRGVRTFGGWGELLVAFKANLALGLGADDPRDGDVGINGVTRNVAAWLAVTRRIWGATTIGVDGARFWTRRRDAGLQRGTWATVYLSADW